ncbi:lipoyl synthase [Halobacteriovorax marinus SJ]|uniref:Lipoyl synthase n=1 Tax=Halobacteriovorax marinus (strain ATCC BAA-682 / DSM 15412 / SJ) TaxID=862908 RepID=E1X650_HALMS|nr:lipoyl synthase [Halobacteriovorax marinus]CBW27394.1 lipoyl synthase [Halobacteriovorax marinus SJ]
MQDYDYEQQRKKIREKREKAQELLRAKKKSTPEKKPDWFKIKLPGGDNYTELKKNLRDNKIWTVCEEASCPNLTECWAAKTATMMILGGTCTRACRFCHVDTGNPKGVINQEEIANAANMAKVMALNYLVITSVDRDDLPDFGASHFANVVESVRENHPKTLVEVLVPDFNAVEEHMDTLAKSNPFVIAQNVETVKRLTHVVRDRRAGYEQSLNCLKYYKDNYPHISTKTSLMVGLGETMEELIECMDDLRSVNCDIITFGQYLRPTQRHLAVERYYTPAEFEELKNIAYEKGFKFVASGPLVRSSYKAADYLKHLREQGHEI